MVNKTRSKAIVIIGTIGLLLNLAQIARAETVLTTVSPVQVAANAVGDLPAPPSTPTLYDPGTTIIDSNFTVDWSDSTSVAGIANYELEEATSPDVDGLGHFVNKVGSSRNVAVSQYSFVDHLGGTYYFHVRTEDVNGFKSNWSNVQDLTITIPVISNIQVTNVTQTSAIVTWQTDVASNSRIEPRGVFKLYNTQVSPDVRVQGVNCAPVEAHGPDITAAQIDKDLQDFAANNVNAVNLFNLGFSDLNKTDATYGSLEERIFGKCAELGMKFVVRLEAYQKPGFAYRPQDADWIIDTYYVNTIQRANRHSGSILYYMINMPLDDTDLAKPTDTQPRDYVT